MTRTRRPFVLRSVLVTVASAAPAIAQPATAPSAESAPAPAVAAYHEHAENYDPRQVRGFTVRVNRALAESNPELLDRVLLLLEHDFQVMQDVLPPPAVNLLTSVSVWVELQGAVVPGGMSGRGMCFHASTEWVTSHGLLAEKTGGVEIVRADDFPVWRRNQPCMTLHEFAHAYHHLLGVDDDAVTRAYEAAKASGLYDAVTRNTENGAVRAYAMTNATEYFAELSEAYFGLNDFYPYTRAQLAQHDPAGLAAIEALWNLPADQITQRVQRTDFMGQLHDFHNEDGAEDRDAVDDD